MRLRKQTNRQTIEKTNMTQPNANSVAEETLRFLFFLCDLLYNVFFELLSVESLFFLVLRM